MSLKISNSAKFFAGIVGFAMVLGFVGAPAAAKAQTTDFSSMSQAQLIALISQLMGGSSMSGGSSMTASTAPVAPLTLGSTGAQVTALQNWLIGKGYSIPAGATGYFGAQTQAALAAWQLSVGLPSNGYYGQASMDKINSMSTVTTTTTTTTTTGGSSSTSNSNELSGEGSVNKFSEGTADESDISEGQEKVELLAIDIELDDEGDLMLDRADIYFEQTATASDSPWDYFDTAYLMVDGDEVADMDVSSKSDWTEEDANTYKLRFSGLDSFLASDETATVSVAFDAASTIDGDDEDAVWEWSVDSDSFRFEDATGFTFTDGDSISNTFSIDSEETADLKITSSNDDPDATTIEVDEETDTNGVTIGIFEIEEEEGVDVNIEEMEVTLQTGSASTTDVVKKVYLYSGSTLIGSETVSDDETGLASTTVVLFDNLDFDVAGDKTEEVTVKADFRKQGDSFANYDNGETVKVTVVTITDATDEFDNDESEMNGGLGVSSETYDSEQHKLFSEGIDVKMGDIKITESEDDNGLTTKINYEIEFDVTAFGDDMFIDKDSLRSSTPDAAASDVALVYTIESGAVATTSGTATASSISSTADEESNYFEVQEGDTETFTITVSFSGASGFFSVQLAQVGYKVGSAGAADSNFDLTPANDFDTIEKEID